MMNTLITFFVLATLFFFIGHSVIDKLSKDPENPPFLTKALYSMVFGLFVTTLGYPVLNMDRYVKEAVGNMNNLEKSGYRYTKQISLYDKRNRRDEIPLDIKETCGSDDYKIIGYTYNEIHMDSHLFHDNKTYLYCRDKNKHRNTVSFIDLDIHKFIAKFDEYPSSQAILEYCELDKAIIVDSNQKPVKPEEIMFIKKSDAYLYCER